jgi:hypothetical protein
MNFDEDVPKSKVYMRQPLMVASILPTMGNSWKYPIFPTAPEPMKVKSVASLSNKA